MTTLKRMFNLKPKPPTWKRIKLGTGLQTGDDFRRALHEAGCRLGATGTDELLDSPDFRVSPREIEVELVRVTPVDLRFLEASDWARSEHYPRLVDMYHRAFECGLALCPDEVGPQLRLQFLDQPKGDCVQIAMKPTFIGTGRHSPYDREGCGFIIDHSIPNKGLFLGAYKNDEPLVSCPPWALAFLQRRQRI